MHLFRFALEHGPRAEFDEANTFALVTFADPEPEFPTRLPTEAEREAARERMPKRIAERQRKAEWEARRNDES